MSAYDRVWTLADISMVTVAAKIMADREVWSLSLTGARETPQVFCSMDSLESVLKETGAQVKVEQHSSSVNWRASAQYGGIEFFALYSERDLRRIGFEVPNYQVQQIQPIEPATA